MPEIRQSEEPPTDPRCPRAPLSILREAIEWALRQGWTVRSSGPLGVEYVAGRWRRIPGAGITPIAAAILRRDPPVSDDRHAAMLTFEREWAFIDGVACGCAIAPASVSRSKAEREEFLLGFEVGLQVRHALVVGFHLLHVAGPERDEGPLTPAPTAIPDDAQPFGGNEETTAVSCMCCATGGLQAHPGTCSASCPRREDCPGYLVAGRPC